MAITENQYTGNGSTVLYSFTFPYLETTDIKVSLNGTVTTAYTLANATTIQFNTAPVNGAAIRIYRQTDDEVLSAQFFPGSAIRSTDLNNNFTQNLYVTQESNRDVTQAITTADAATATANTALSNSTAAQADATTAISTANAASSAAANAVSIANTASSNASAAVSTANTANTNATAALNAAAEALAYTVVADVAAIPGSPVNGDAIRILDSTGIESFTPLNGLPGGFIGESGLTVEIYYNSASTTWVWVRYYPTDPEARYVGVADIGVTVQAYDATLLNDADIGVTVQPYDATYLVDADIDVTVQSYDADTVKQDVLPTFTTATRTTERTITAGAFDLSTGNLWTVGAITVPNPTNAAAGQTGAIRITAGPVVWSSNFKFPSGTAPTIAAFPAIIPFYVQDASTILMGNVVEGIA
jgi:hypothetical protein